MCVCTFDPLCPWFLHPRIQPTMDLTQRPTDSKHGPRVADHNDGEPQIGRPAVGPEHPRSSVSWNPTPTETHGGCIYNCVFYENQRFN